MLPCILAQNVKPQSQVNAAAYATTIQTKLDIATSVNIAVAPALSATQRPLLIIATIEREPDPAPPIPRHLNVSVLTITGVTLPVSAREIDGDELGASHTA